MGSWVRIIQREHREWVSMRENVENRGWGENKMKEMILDDKEWKWKKKSEIKMEAKLKWTLDEINGKQWRRDKNDVVTMWKNKKKKRKVTSVHERKGKKGSWFNKLTTKSLSYPIKINPHLVRSGCWQYSVVFDDSSKERIVLLAGLRIGWQWLLQWRRGRKSLCKMSCPGYDTQLHLGGARYVMVIVVGNGLGDTSSNPGRDWLHFT